MYRYFKRILSVFISILGIMVLLPIFLVISIVIKVDSKGPVFFKQKRVGKNKELFSILKFRTMRVDTPKDCPTHLLTDPDEYITKIGFLLRKTSLDELPQLFNILWGHMAIVGPRPALWNQDDLVAERDNYNANDIRPGLTGWAQINGRDELEIKTKARYDGEYVEKMSFIFDVKCLLLTLTAVLKKDGIVEGGTGAIVALEPEAVKQEPEGSIVH